MQRYIGVFITDGGLEDPMDLLELALEKPMFDDDTGEECWAYFEKWEYDTPYLHEVFKGNPYEYVPMASLDLARCNQELDACSTWATYWIVKEGVATQHREKIPTPEPSDITWEVCLVEYEDYS